MNKTLPGISIEADRYFFNEEKYFASYSVISKSDISHSNPRQVSELLAHQPGLFIKDYGGLNGIKTISMRGTSSQQTLVLLEGMKLNSIQTNSIDFATLPLSFLRSIEIIRSGSSALSGSSSLGGAINFNLDDCRDSKLNASLGYGSFNETFASLSSNISLSESAGIGLAGEYLSSLGDFPFTTKQYGTTSTYNRKNSDFENLNIMINSFFSSGLWKHKFLVLGRMNERGTPGAVLYGYISPDLSRLNEKDINLLAKSSAIIDNSILSAGLLYRHNEQEYYAPFSLQAMMGDTVSYFSTNEYQFKADYDIEYSHFNMKAGIETCFSGLHGDLLQTETGGKVNRKNAGISFSTSYSANSTFFTNVVTAGLRYDIYSDHKPSPSALLGSAFSFNGIDMTVKTMLSYNYRPPSFNEMYYLNYGTADLKSEKSISYNISAVYDINMFNVELNFFLIDTKDQIIAVPKTPLVWSAKNMSSVFSRGLELSSGLSLLGKLIKLQANYTIQKVTDNEPASPTFNKLVQYVPQEMAASGLVIEYKNFNFGLSLRYSGFTFALPDNSYDSMIHSFWNTDVTISQTLEFSANKIIIKLTCRNLFDSRYEIVKNYPMPGRFLRLGIDYILL